MGVYEKNKTIIYLKEKYIETLNLDSCCGESTRTRLVLGPQDGARPEPPQEKWARATCQGTEAVAFILGGDVPRSTTHLPASAASLAGSARGRELLLFIPMLPLLTVVLSLNYTLSSIWCLTSNPVETQQGEAWQY